MYAFTAAEFREWAMFLISMIAAFGGLMAFFKRSIRKMIRDEIQPDLQKIKEDLKQTRAELTVNGGLSVKDVVNRIERRLHRLEERRDHT